MVILKHTSRICRPDLSPDLLQRAVFTLAAMESTWTLLTHLSLFVTEMQISFWHSTGQNILSGLYNK